MGIDDVDVLALRRFIAVAEERSFSRAALRLHLAQPPLSRAIRDLEAAVGTPLFVRTTRRVELTAAGQVLLDEGRAAVACVEAAARRAARVAAREKRLVVATKPGAATLLTAIVRHYETMGGGLPKVKVALGGWGEQEAMLGDGRADVAFVRCPFTSAVFDQRVLFEEERVVALPASHPLAKRRLLRRSELAGEPVPVWPPATPEIAAHRAGVDSVAALADVPSGPPVHDLIVMLEAVALGQGIAFLPRSTAAESRRAGVVFVPVRDLTPSRVGVAWPRSLRSDAVAAFVKAAVAVTCRSRRAAALA
jgi:DNA-binding transcriptional LysR family regulator